MRNAANAGPTAKIVPDLLRAVCLKQPKPRTFGVDRILTTTDARGAAIRDMAAWLLAAEDAQRADPLRPSGAFGSGIMQQDLRVRSFSYGRSRFLALCTSA